MEEDDNERRSRRWNQGPRSMAQRHPAGGAKGDRKESRTLFHNSQCSFTSARRQSTDGLEQQEPILELEEAQCEEIRIAKASSPRNVPGSRSKIQLILG